jgi:uncharacterized protein YkwD
MPLRLAVALVAILALVAALPVSPASAAPADRGCRGADDVPTQALLAQTRRATLCLVNAERAKRGRRPLRANRELRRSSQRYAGDMVARRFFSHVSPGGAELLERVRGVGRYLRGARGYVLGENLAWGTSTAATPRAIVASWMRSRGHRRNVLDRRYRDTELGVALGVPRAGLGSGATYAQHFGMRR